MSSMCEDEINVHYNSLIVRYNQYNLFGGQYDYMYIVIYIYIKGL